MSKTIWVNTLIQNEDKFIWFAIMSVIDYVDKILIFDTGSTDKTVAIIKEIQTNFKDKVIFKEWGQAEGKMLTDLRHKQFEQSKCDFVLVLDGDEIWPESSIKKAVERINHGGDNIDGIVVPFYNLMGDIYHYQDDTAGRYNLLGRKGNLTIRFANRRVPEMQVKNKYPDEGFFIGDMALQDSKKLVFLDAPYLHATHLVRSSVGRQDKRYKIKFEVGHAFPKNFDYPKAFYSEFPKNVGSPLRQRSMSYTLFALLQYPLRFILRRLRK